MQGSGRPIKVAPPEWLRGPAHIEKGYVILDTKRAERYEPMETTDLTFDLARVRRPSDAQEFCARYGLLWHGPEATEFREDFSRWEDEARDLRVVLLLNRAVRGAVAGDEEARSELSERWAPIFAPILEEPEIVAEINDPAERLLIVASSFIATQVSEKLAGVEEGIGAACEFSGKDGRALGPPGTYVFTPHPQNLLGYVYHHVAMLLVNRAPMDACQECGGFFIVTDRRQQFCTKACSARVRQRRWLQKRANPVC